MILSILSRRGSLQAPVIRLFIFKYSIFHETWLLGISSGKTHYKILNLKIKQVSVLIYRSKNIQCVSSEGSIHRVKSTLIIFEGFPVLCMLFGGHKFDMSYTVKRVISNCWLLDSLFQADV